MAFVFYVSQLLAWTLFPLPIDPALIEERRAIADAGFSARGNNFTLFETLRESTDSEFSFVSQIVGNFLLLTPLGFLAPLIWDRFAKLSNGVALVVGTTLAIEFSQLGISGILGFTYRSFDVDDLWLNALGGSIALAIGVCVRNMMAASRDKPVPEVVATSASSHRAVTDSRETALYQSERG